MRNIFVFMAICMFVACSKSPQQRAESLIRDYLEQNANDPSSIEIISISELKPWMADKFEQTTEYEILQEQLKDWEKMQADAKKDGFDNEFDEEIKEVKEEIKKASKDFKPYHNEYVNLEYRAKNGFGALMKSHAIVEFDKEVTEIISFSEIGK